MQELEHRIAALLDAGDLPGAATAVLRGYGPHIMSYLRLVTRDDDATVEVFSQFGEDLWRGLPAFRRECSMKSYAYRLAWHAALRYRDDAFRRRVRRLETAEVSQLVGELKTTLLGARDRALGARLDRIRRRLSPEEQTLLTLRVDREFTWKEISDVLSEAGEPLEEPILRKRFERLRRKLRELAAAEGL